jgi:hypothetical protein
VQFSTVATIHNSSASVRDTTERTGTPRSGRFFEPGRDEIIHKVSLFLFVKGVFDAANTVKQRKLQACRLALCYRSVTYRSRHFLTKLYCGKIEFEQLCIASSWCGARRGLAKILLPLPP